MDKRRHEVHEPARLAHNLLHGLPYPTGHFEVVYHSQVLEHFPKEKAPSFLAECYRVLRPMGILRVVVPDLENIAKEYLRHLAACIDNPSDVHVARSGRVARNIVERVRQRAPSQDRIKKNRSFAARVIKKTRRKLAKFRDRPTREAIELGRFRLGGEVHLWMYDRFSLSRLLQDAGFHGIRVVGPHESSIPGWADYGLDVRDGIVCDPSSLFMEAVKPP